MKTYSSIFAGEPWRNRKLKVRGICEYDVLNPCWDNRASDRVGHHWGSTDEHVIPACAACTNAAKNEALKRVQHD